MDAGAAAAGGDAPATFRSIFGTDPLDEFVVSIGAWIYHVAEGGNAVPEGADAEVEVEAKIGTLIDQRTGERVRIGAGNECILADTSSIRFESGMSQASHRHYNTLLNSLCEPSKSRPRVQYKRHNEIDYFYASSEGSGRSREKVRVTREADSLRTKERGSVIKKRLGNLEVHCPGKAFDYRISVNLEIQAPEPSPDQPHDFYREKNRLSYTHDGGVRIDLTQVKVPPANNGAESSLQHELEVEMVTAPSPSSRPGEGSPGNIFSLITPHSSCLAALNTGIYASTLGIAAPGAMKSPDASLNGQQGGQDWTPYEDAVARMINDVRLLIRNASNV
ncbi:unnamed protein product [Parajaminaea phylloscopi]